MKSEEQLKQEFEDRYNEAVRIEKNKEKIRLQKAGIKKQRNRMKHLQPKKKKRK